MSMILNTIYNPPLHEGGVREAVVTRIFATPLRYSEYTADVNPAAVGRNHLRQGDPLLELSNGQIISAPVDGELDWCLPVGSQVTKLTAFGAYMKETGSQSIEVIVKLPSWQPAKPTINQFGWHMAPTAKLSRCFKSVGDQVRKGEPVAAFITEEGEIILVSAPADGKITQECGPASCGAWWRPEDWVVKLRVPLPTPERRIVLSTTRELVTVTPKQLSQVSLPQPPERRIALGTDLDTGKLVTVTTEQLCSGCYILGVQGMGKSSLLVEMGRQQLALNESVIVFDPHGQLIDDLVARMPRHRLKDTYHLDLKDREYPFGLNVFACANPDDEEERDRTRNQVIHAFEKLWPETRSGVYFKKLLRHLVILLIEQPELTLADIPRLLQESTFRTRFTDSLRNTSSRDFWRYDYGMLSPARQRTEAGPLLTRVDELLAEPVITRILCQPQSTINLRSLIEQRKNLFIRLPVNEDAYTKAAGLVGTMLMASVYATTFSFADLPESERPGFSLIVDEFQNFATDEFARLFAQGRKFKAKQILAHQYRDQLAEASMEANKSATLTAQTKVIFSVTKADAAALAEDFVPFEQRRQPANLDVTPLSAMDRHPNPVVKEFAYRYGQPLEEGSRDKIKYPHYTLREKQDLYYEKFPKPVFYPFRDFGFGSQSFSPREAEEIFKLLNELLYFSQKAGRVDEERETLVLKKMKRLIGEDREVAVWHPGFEEQYEKLGEELSVLKRNKPAVSYPPNKFGKIMGVAIEEEVDLETYKEKIKYLCLPTLAWANEHSLGFEIPQPAEIWTRHTSEPVDAKGRVPYVFTGDPASIYVSLLSFDRIHELDRTLRTDARRMLADWLSEEVIWFWKGVKTCWWRETKERGEFQAIVYTGRRPLQWLRQLREAEGKEAQKAQKTQQAQSEWKQKVAETEALRDYLYQTHRRMVPEESPQTQRFRQELHQVIEALVADPVTVGRNTTTSKDVGLTLQHQPQRRAYVRIGTAAYVMKTLPLAERVTKQEEQRRFAQLRAQTRRTLCRHVSQVDSHSSRQETRESPGHDEHVPVRLVQATDDKTAPQPQERGTSTSYQPFFEEQVDE